jgi:hypothetical protein
MKSKPVTYDDFLRKELRSFKLSIAELQMLREVISARTDISGKVATISMVFQQALNATRLIETLQNRVNTSVWKKIDKQRRPLVKGHRG